MKSLSAFASKSKPGESARLCLRFLLRWESAFRQTINLLKMSVSRPVEELILRLNDLKIKTKGGKRRASAVAQLGL